MVATSLSPHETNSMSNSSSTILLPTVNMNAEKKKKAFSLVFYKNVADRGWQEEKVILFRAKKEIVIDHNYGRIKTRLIFTTRVRKIKWTFLKFRIQYGVKYNKSLLRYERKSNSKIKLAV